MKLRGGGPFDPQEVSLRRYLDPGFMPVSPAPQAMVSFRVDKSVNFVAPSAYDDRFTSFGYVTPWDGYPAFDAKVVDTTGGANLSEGSGLTWDTPDPIEFLMGEYYCPYVQGGNSDITQNYYTRSGFTLDDFRVKIEVSGPHHMYEIIPIAGVEVESFDEVYFKWAILRSIPEGSFEQAPTADRTLFASITYTRSPGSNLAAKETVGDLPGPIIPPTGYWVTKTSTITFEYYDEDVYYMKAPGDPVGTGQQHWVVAESHNVVSKWWVDAAQNHTLYATQMPESFDLLQKYPNPFNDKADADYRAILAAIAQGKKALYAKPRVDMPHAQPLPYPTDFAGPFTGFAGP